MSTAEQENVTQSNTATVNPLLLEILACPKCKSEETDLNYEAEKQRFTCTTCKLVYAVRDGIPNFIVQEATEL
jgi:uncharacterized protein YbaR (Trm112 family)